MKIENKQLILYELIILLLSIILGFFIPVIFAYKIPILVVVCIYLFEIIFGLKRKKQKGIKDTILALTVFMVTFLVIYYAFGFLVEFTLSGGNSIFFIIPTLAYVLGREVLRYNILEKSNNNKYMIGLSVLLFIVLDLSNSANILLNNTEMKTSVQLLIILLPLISNNISLTFLSRKGGCIPTMYYAGMMSILRFIIPVIPNTNMWATTAIDIIVPILLWVRMSGYFQKIENSKDPAHDNLINLTILLFPVILMVIMIYFTSGFFRYKSILIGTNNLKPILNKGDIVIIDQKKSKTIKPGNIIAYKKDNNMILAKVTNKEKLIEEYIYDVEIKKETDQVTEQEIVGVVDMKIKQIGWPALWLREGGKNE